MNIDNLILGTKLMWDAPEPFDGYAKDVYKRDDHRIIYPYIVTNRKSKNPFLTCHIKSSLFKGHWIRGEVPQLRYPTKEELNTLTWFDYHYKEKE